MKIGPAVGDLVQPHREVLEALRIKFLDGVLDDRPGLLELDRRQASPTVPAVVAEVASVGDGFEERVDGVADVRRVDFVRVGKVGGADDTIVPDAGLVGKWWNMRTRLQRRVVRTSIDKFAG